MATNKIVDAEKNKVILEVHPSMQVGYTFKNSKCFSICNKYLEENGRTPIDWNVDQWIRKKGIHIIKMIINFINTHNIELIINASNSSVFKIL